MSERVAIHLVWAATAMTTASMAAVVALAAVRCDAFTPTAIAGCLSLAGPLTGALAVLLYRVGPPPTPTERPSS